MSDHAATDEAISRIEKKHTHSQALRVTTNYKAAFIELGFEMADMEKRRCASASNQQGATPRTDAQRRVTDASGAYVSVSFARELELDYAALGRDMEHKFKSLRNERDSYLGRVLECMTLLEAAGMGNPGKPNTLVAMVQEIITERDAALAVAEEFLRRWEQNGFYETGHEGLAEQARLALAKGADLSGAGYFDPTA